MNALITAESVHGSELLGRGAKIWVLGGEDIQDRKFAKKIFSHEGIWRIFSFGWDPLSPCRAHVCTE